MSATWTRCVVLLLITVVAYFQTWAELWPLWERKYDTYTHGTLIAAISLWLVWRARTALNRIPATTERRALPVVVVLSLTWLLAARAHLMLVHTTLWPVLAFAILWAGAGWQAARKLAFPLVLLYFAIPVWDYLEPVLHFIAAHIVSLLVNITGTRATVDGSYIVLPQMTILIALACSGAHFFAVSLAMGAIAGEMRGDTPRTRLLILALAGVLGIAFNAIRILLIVLAYLNPTLRTGFEQIGHITFGWWVFLLDIVVFYLALRLVPMSAAATPVPAASTPATSAVGARASLWPAAAAALVLPLIALATPRIGHYPGAVPDAVGVPGATGPLSGDLRWVPQFNGAAWAHRAAYLLPNGRVIELYSNEYHEQSEGRELISRDAILFPQEAFPIQMKSAVLLQRPHAVAIEAWRMQLRDQSGRDWSALYTYVVDGRTERDSSRARLLTAARSIYRRSTAGIFGVASPCVPDCNAVAADLEQFAVRAYDVYESTRNTP